MPHTNPLGAGYALRENGLWLSDTTEWNVSPSRHGFAPKLPSDPTRYLDGMGNYTVPGAVGSSAPALYNRHHWGYLAHPALNNAFTNTSAIVNMSAVQGSLTAAQDATGAWVRWNTGALTGNRCAVQTGGFNLCRRGWDPVVIVRTKSYTDLSSMRFWLGLSETDSWNQDDPLNGDIIMFRFSTSAGDTEFMACVKDGTTLSATATGVTPATDTEYTFLIECDNGEARFYINGALVHTATSGMPLTTQLLGFHWTLTTLTNAARSWLFESFKGSHLQ